MPSVRLSNSVEVTYILMHRLQASTNMINKNKTKDRLPRLGKRELICLLLLTCNYVVSVRRGFLLLLVLGMGCVILLWYSLSRTYNYFMNIDNHIKL